MRKPRSHIIFIIVFFIIFTLMQNFQENMIFSREKISSGKVWLIWSSQLIHTNYPHLLMNTFGLSILLVIYQNTYSTIQLVVRVAYLSSLIGFGLYFFSPEIHQYAGFSGILYGLFIISAVHAHHRSDYMLAYPIFIAITGKVIWEQFDNTINTASASFINSSVATDAHLYGYIAALVFSLFSILYRYKRSLL